MSKRKWHVVTISGDSIYVSDEIHEKSTTTIIRFSYSQENRNLAVSMCHKLQSGELSIKSGVSDEK